MPEFNFKKNGAASKTATATTTQSNDKKTPTPTKANFTRNSGKYATLPTKRSTEPVKYVALCSNVKLWGNTNHYYPISIVYKGLMKWPYSKAAQWSIRHGPREIGRAGLGCGQIGKNSPFWILEDPCSVFFKIAYLFWSESIDTRFPRSMRK